MEKFEFEELSSKELEVKWKSLKGIAYMLAATLVLLLCLTRAGFKS